MKAEVDTLQEHGTFRVLDDGESIPSGFKKIPYHCIYDVKFDGRRKCRLVAGGHMTDPSTEDVYSGVVDMKTVRIVFVVAQLNGLLCVAGDVGNAFLFGITKECVFIIAGPEFGPELCGKIHIIFKALYGLKSSSARFHEHLSATLRNMGYKPTRADFDLYMKDKGDHY